MKVKISIFAIIATIAASAVIADAVQAYRAWKRRQISHLEMESALAETAAGPIEYRVWGEGPAVLVIHGSPGGYDQGFAFAKLVDSQKCSFIALSRPGYLRTPLWVAQTPEEQADLYAHLLDTLGIERAAIIGISGGGPSALQFALRHAERCRGLALVSAVSGRYDEAELRRKWQPIRRFVNQIYNSLVGFDPFLHLLLPLARLHPDHAVSAELIQSVTMYHLRKIGYKNDMARFAALSPYPLERITVPTFAVHGTRDNEVPFEHAMLLARKIPQVKLLTISNSGHMSFYTHAHIVMPELRAFLERL